MKEIKDFNIARLRTEEDFGFQNKIVAETVLLTLESDQEMVNAFKVALAAFDLALKHSLSNSHTAEVKAADELTDAAWRGLRAQTKVMLDFPNEEKRVIAHKVLALINKYGDITHMAYSEEYGRLLNLLQDLAALGVEAQQQIYVDVWVVEMQKHYDAYMAAISKQAAEHEGYVVGDVAQKRKDADAAFRALVKRVNALALINGVTVYSSFIDRANFFIDRELKNLASRTGHTEKPITPDVPIDPTNPDDTPTPPETV